MPPRTDAPLLFPTPSGRIWWERNLYRDVWYPTRERRLEQLGYDLEELSDAQRANLIAEHRLGITPHEVRHNWESHLRAAGIDQADLAEMAGQSVETMNRGYVHALGRSADAVRVVIV